jgi:hypothetical protein
MEETIYTLSRNGLLHMRESLYALSANAEQVEGWASTFSHALVCLPPLLSLVLASMLTTTERSGSPQ